MNHLNSRPVSVSPTQKLHVYTGTLGYLVVLYPPSVQINLYLGIGQPKFVGVASTLHGEVTFKYYSYLRDLSELPPPMPKLTDVGGWTAPGELGDLRELSALRKTWVSGMQLVIVLNSPFNNSSWDAHWCQLRAKGTRGMTTGHGRYPGFRTGWPKSLTLETHA